MPLSYHANASQARLFFERTSQSVSRSSFSTGETRAWDWPRPAPARQSERRSSSRERGALRVTCSIVVDADRLCHDFVRVAVAVLT